jgi:hypothetical protein
MTLARCLSPEVRLNLILIHLRACYFSDDKADLIQNWHGCLCWSQWASCLATAREPQMGQLYVFSSEDVQRK